MHETAWTYTKKAASILIGISSLGVGDFDKNAAPSLKGIMEVGGAHPRKELIDYQICFKRTTLFFGICWKTRH